MARHPIVYVRGFAALQSEIEETVADPYMGFNIGATKSRVSWTGDVKRYFFESPLVRLMSDGLPGDRYEDVYVDGDDLTAPDCTRGGVPYRCVVIYRYYDQASADFGDGKGTPPIPQFAIGLSKLIERLRDRVCANPLNAMNPADFRVHLVAHSMGGLICRAFLQNKDLDPSEMRGTVDKVFTYATPHNGIDMRIVRNVPGWASFGDVNNFNRRNMAGFFGLPLPADGSVPDDVSIVDDFPVDRIFNLVGTNARDYPVLYGLSSWAAGDASDGLVRLQNATTHGPSGPGGADVVSPRAYVNRSHSGPYGIVNSEEGYQNLVRFLFGNVRVDGILDIDDITLPVEVEQARKNGSNVKASYQFEVAVGLRGCQWQITRREVRENSAIFRTYDELFPPPASASGEKVPDRSRSPHLFSVFMDRSKSVEGDGSDAFALDLKVLVPDYEVDGLLFLKKHYEGGYIFRETILIKATPNGGGPWTIEYGWQSVTPGQTGQKLDAVWKDGVLLFAIPIAQASRPGLTCTLRFEARGWN